MEKISIFLILAFLTLELHAANITETLARLERLIVNTTKTYETQSQNLLIVAGHLQESSLNPIIDGNRELKIAKGNQLGQRMQIERDVFLKRANSSCLQQPKGVLEQAQRLATLRVNSCPRRFLNQAKGYLSQASLNLQQVLQVLINLKAVLINCPHSKDAQCVDKVHKEVLVQEGGALKQMKGIYEDILNKAEAFNIRMSFCASQEVDILKRQGDDMLAQMKNCVGKS